MIFVNLDKNPPEKEGESIVGLFQMKGSMES